MSHKYIGEESRPIGTASRALQCEAGALIKQSAAQPEGNPSFNARKPIRTTVPKGFFSEYIIQTYFVSIHSPAISMARLYIGNTNPKATVEEALSEESPELFFVLYNRSLNQLDEWVRGNTRDAQGKIVELVWRLVAVSSSNPKERRFPLGDSIGQPGLDGNVKSESMVVDHLWFLSQSIVAPQFVFAEQVYSWSQQAIILQLENSATNPFYQTKRPAPSLSNA